MDYFIQHLISGIKTSFTVFADPTSYFFLPYTFTTILLAYFVYKRLDKKPEKFTDYLFDAESWGHRSAKIDYKIFVINNLLRAFAIPILLTATIFAEFVQDLLYTIHPLSSRILSISMGSIFAVTFITFAVSDLILFLSHYAFHKVPILWEFHKIHHSAVVLNPVTSRRFHILEDLINMSLTNIGIGIVLGISGYLFQTEIKIVHILALNIFDYVFNIVGANLRHSNIKLHYPDWLSRILISPVQHHVHHSSLPQHIDKNFGFMFACWDRIFKTLHIPVKGEEMRWGLSERENEKFYKLSHSYFGPFKAVKKRISKKMGLNKKL